MRKSLFFILLLAMIGLTNGAQAQIAVMDTSIVQYLERPETGGKVKVVQPAQLAKRVSRAEGVIKYDGNKGYAQSSGFSRIGNICDFYVSVLAIESGRFSFV